MAIENGSFFRNPLLYAGAGIAGIALTLSGCGTSDPIERSNTNPTVQATATPESYPTGQADPDESSPTEPAATGPTFEHDRPSTPSPTYEEEQLDDDEQAGEAEPTPSPQLSEKEEASKAVSIVAAEKFKDGCKDLVRAYKDGDVEISRPNTMWPDLGSKFGKDNPTGGSYLVMPVGTDNLVTASFAGNEPGKRIQTGNCTAVSFVDGLGTGNVPKFLDGVTSAAKKIVSVTIYADPKLQTGESSYAEPDNLVIAVHNGTKTRFRSDLANYDSGKLTLGDREGGYAITSEQAQDAALALDSAERISGGY